MVNKHWLSGLIGGLLAVGLMGCKESDSIPGARDVQLQESDFVQPPTPGKYAVGTTNLEVADDFQSIDTQTMDLYLAGRPDEEGNIGFISDILKHPEDAIITMVDVPDRADVYGPASGETMPIVSFVTYPSKTSDVPNAYDFPYMNSEFGQFADMLEAGEAPDFADADTKYPLILLSHGSTAHGIYDIGHAHDLSRSGYIVAVLFYGDERTPNEWGRESHWNFLRPLYTSKVIDDLLAHPEFGPRIDKDNIGVSGHSFGGFTALAMAGGQINGTEETSHDYSTYDPRVSAAVLAAPWVGNKHTLFDFYAFTEENSSLKNITIPVITLFGTNDEATTASTIVPAKKLLSGPRYLVELIDQPHIFEGPSWEDRNAWELAFFNAYLKGDEAALEKINNGKSMAGGNKDAQWFDYQQTAND